MTRRRASSIAFALLFTAAATIGCQTPPPPPPPTAPPARDTHEMLDSVLWMQASGEYWAAATTAYRNAMRGLNDGLASRTWTAAVEQTGAFATKPPAVILDLDETVLDNSPYQGQLVQARTRYTDDLWQTWVSLKQAAAIPGAVEFLAYARSRHVDVFFVTNRSAGSKTVTIDNLKALGLPATPENVLCNGEHDWTSDKTSRRAFVAKTHRIVLLIGDDLNDFIAATTLDPAARRSLAQQYADRWGSKWILLPNAMYGGWDQAITRGVSDDAGQLAARMKLVRGFQSPVK